MKKDDIEVTWLIISAKSTESVSGLELSFDEAVEKLLQRVVKEANSTGSIPGDRFPTCSVHDPYRDELWSELASIELRDINYDRWVTNMDLRMVVPIEIAHRMSSTVVRVLRKWISELQG